MYNGGSCISASWRSYRRSRSCCALLPPRVEKYVGTTSRRSPSSPFVGLASLAFGLVLGISLWLHAESTGLPTPTGSIVLVLLALVVGFQLCLQAIVLDIQATPR
jgi:hypothetical protein